MKSVRSNLVLALVLTIVFLGIAMALANQRRTTAAVDVFDETSHYSYVLALKSGTLPRDGDMMPPLVLNTIDCDSWWAQARCGSPPAKASAYHDYGYNYETVQPPLGYLPYVVTSTTGSSLVGDLEQTRLGGFIWIALSGLAMLTFALIEDMSLLALAGLLSITLLNPCFTWAAGTINNDSAALFAAMASVLVLSLGVRKGRFRWFSFPLFMLAGLVIGLTKGVFVIAPFALLVAAVFERPPLTTNGRELIDSLKSYLPSATIFVFAAAGNEMWLYFQKIRSVVSQSVLTAGTITGIKEKSVNLVQVGDGIKNLAMLFSSYLGNFATNEVLGLVVVSMLLVIAVARLFRGRLDVATPGSATLRLSSGSLAIGILVSVVAESIFVSAYSWEQSGVMIAAPSRYYIALLPLIALALLSSRKRWLPAVVCIAFPVVVAGLQLAHMTTGTFHLSHF